MLHNEHLEKRFGVGFHTISVPRIRDSGSLANGKAPANESEYPYAVDDEDFLRLAAILRIAVPFTGMIVSTREHPEMRRKLAKAGISQMSAGSSTTVGGYSKAAGTGQFSLADHRDAKEIFYWLMEEGILPSFCTACYRQGRSGDRFMELAKSGDIKNICLPNGLLTLKEYALDYGDERFKSLASKLINEKLEPIKNKKTYDLVKEKLAQLEQGKRDLFI
jgi:2-iminoacetate synthase